MTKKILIILMLLLVTREGYVSQVHHMDQPKEYVIEGATCVVVARKADPSSTSEKLGSFGVAHLRACQTKVTICKYYLKV